MTRKQGWFVDDQKISVFVQNLKYYFRFCRYVSVLSSAAITSTLIVRADQPAFAIAPAVDADASARQLDADAPRRDEAHPSRTR